LAICIFSLLCTVTCCNARPDSASDFSSSTAATVNAYFGFLGNGNFTGLVTLMDESITVTSPGNSTITPWSGTFVGPNAVVGWYASFFNLLTQVNNTMIANFTSNTTGVVIAHFYWTAVSTQILFAETAVDVLEVSPTTGLVTSIRNTRDTYPAFCALSGKVGCSIVPLIQLPPFNASYPVSDTYSTLLNYLSGEPNGTFGDYVVDNPTWFVSGDPQVVPWAGTYYTKDAVLAFIATLHAIVHSNVTPVQIIPAGNYVLAIGFQVHYVIANGNGFNITGCEMLAINNGKIEADLNVEDTYYAVIALHSGGTSPTTAPTTAPTDAPTTPPTTPPTIAPTITPTSTTGNSPSSSGAQVVASTIMMVIAVLLLC